MENEKIIIDRDETGKSYYFPENDCPTEEELETIKTWPIKGRDSIGLLFKYIQRLWRWDRYFTVKGNTFELSTGGWSGNEDIIGAMQENFVFWSLCWKSSRVGGHYVFKVPKLKKRNVEK